MVKSGHKAIDNVPPLQLIDGNGVVTAESLLAATGIDVGVGGEVSGEINDGTVLYIDPNDPQAAALLQQAGQSTLIRNGPEKFWLIALLWHLIFEPDNG